MSRRVRHTETESAQKYRQGIALLASGGTILQAAKKLGVSEATFHRWRRKFGPPSRASPERSSSERSSSERSAPQVGDSRLKQLEKENKRLKLMVAELTLENSFLKDRLDGANGRDH